MVLLVGKIGDVIFADFPPNLRRCRKPDILSHDFVFWGIALIWVSTFLLDFGANFRGGVTNVICHHTRDS